MDFSLLQHSAFLNALGSAILNSLWQTAILWAAFHTVFIFYKKNTASLKNVTATVFVILAFFIFCISFSEAFFQKHHLHVATPIHTETVQAAEGTIAFSLETITKYATGLLPFLSVAYILLLLFFMARLAKAYRYIKIISNRFLLKAAPDLHFFTIKAAAVMNISKKISVWISEHIDVPAAIGFFKPVILIPFASVNNLSSHQLEAIILHELAHIKRNDYVINLIISVVETILFFNPFVMLLVNVIKRERENCCDDFVLRYQYDPHAYATALLRLEQARASTLKLSMGAVSGKQQLLSRIKRITNNNHATRQFNYIQKLIALVAVTGIIFSFAWLSPEKNTSVLPPAKSEIAIHKKIVSSPVENSVDKIITFRKNIKLTSLPKENTIQDDEPGNFSADASFDDAHEDAINSLDAAQQVTKAFGDHSIHLPTSIILNNVPFLPQKFNIDLSKINVDDLNKNLQIAYEQINNLNWKKIQAQINEGIKNAEIESLSAEMEAGAAFQKTKIISQLKKAQQQFNFDSLFALQHLFQEAPILTQKKLSLIKRNLSSQQKIQQKIIKNIQETSPIKQFATVAPSDENDELKMEPENLHAIEKEKNIKIVLKHLLHSTTKTSSANKKIIEFSFNSDENSDSKSVVNIELDN